MGATINKSLKQLLSGGQLALIIGPVLVLCIVLATVNLLSTYKGIHKQKQATIWSLIQLDRQIGSTLFDAQQYTSGHLSASSLRQNYQSLVNRFPVTFNSLDNDKIFKQVVGLSDSIHSTFAHVKTAEKLFSNSQNIDADDLNHWLTKTNEMKTQINEKVLDSITSMTSEYSDKAFATIVKTAALLLFVIVTFIGYLAYLLMALRKERKRNLYMLAHDPLTGLSSRKCIMTSLRSRCNSQKPFALLMFTLLTHIRIAR